MSVAKYGRCKCGGLSKRKWDRLWPEGSEMKCEQGSQ